METQGLLNPNQQTPDLKTETSTMAKDVAILGVGMHPWGKWGKNFVEYGLKALSLIHI